MGSTMARAFQGLIEVAIILGLLGAATACDSDQPYQTYQKKRTEEKRAAMQADEALLANMTQADMEFKRRLRERVTMRDGVILVREIYTPEVATVHGFPAATAWSITCGVVGLSITFGAGTSEGGGIVDLRISEATLNVEQCGQFVPSLAREVAATTDSGFPNRPRTSW
jgi:hypothetical protein